MDDELVRRAKPKFATGTTNWQDARLKPNRSRSGKLHDHQLNLVAAVGLEPTTYGL